MRPTIELFVVSVPHHHPDGLAQIWRDLEDGCWVERDYVCTFSYVADPPPDTLFMRVFGMDLSVFGEDVPGAALQMIDHHSLTRYQHAATLARHVETEANTTVARMVDYASQRGVTCAPDAVRAALLDGAWPTMPDAMLQAAAFAHHLRQAAELALARGLDVVWFYRDVVPRYDYP